MAGGQPRCDTCGTVTAVCSGICVDTCSSLEQICTSVCGIGEVMFLVPWGLPESPHAQMGFWPGGRQGPWGVCVAVCGCASLHTRPGTVHRRSGGRPVCAHPQEPLCPRRPPMVHFARLRCTALSPLYFGLWLWPLSLRPHVTRHPSVTSFIAFSCSWLSRTRRLTTVFVTKGAHAFPAGTLCHSPSGAARRWTVPLENQCVSCFTRGSLSHGLGTV